MDVRLMLAALLCGVCGASGLARADRVAIVARATPGAPAPASEVAKVAAAAVSGEGHEPILEPLAKSRARLAKGAVPSGQLSGFARARTLIAQGWQAYLAVDPARARSLLQSARTAAKTVASLPGGHKVLADIALRLGAAALAVGDRDTAAAEFGLARALDPHRRVTIATFSPEVVSAYEAAAPRPPPSPGVPTDASPALDESLSRGTALLAAETTLGALTLFSDADAVLVVVAAWRHGRPAALAQACTPQGAAIACGRVIEIVSEQPTPKSPRAAITAATERALAALSTPDQRATLLADARVFPGEAPPVPPSPGERDSLWTSPYLWIGVGTAALATAATIFVIARDDHRSTVISVPCDSFGICQ